MLETRCAHGALSADILGWLSLLVRGGVEDHGVEAATGSVLAPGLLHGGGMVFLVDGTVQPARSRGQTPTANRLLDFPAGHGPNPCLGAAALATGRGR